MRYAILVLIGRGVYEVFVEIMLNFKTRLQMYHKPTTALNVLSAINVHTAK